MQDFFEYLNKSVDINDEAKSFISSVIKIRKFNKGDVLITQGQSEVLNNYFVFSGCLRSYVIDKDGNDHTVEFAIKDWWISDYIAIHTDELASLTIECLTESKVIEFNAKELDGIYARFPEFESYQRHNLERHVVSLYKRILNQLQLSAVERYDLFLNQYPDIEQYTRNFHIASYLGITQQSLSRIRVEKVKK